VQTRKLGESLVTDGWDASNQGSCREAKATFNNTNPLRRRAPIAHTPPPHTHPTPRPTPQTPQWSPDDRQLASGGNDNALLIWDAAASTAPSLRFAEHTAAVKAIAWCGRPQTPMYVHHNASKMKRT
jgi:WD40 repeat protein